MKRETDDVEGVERTLRFERAKGKPAHAEFPFHVGPRGVAALAGDFPPAIEDSVEDLDPEMRHPDLVGVRKRDGETEVDGSGIFSDGVDLSPGVPAWLFDGEKEFAGMDGGWSAHVPFSLSGNPVIHGNRFHLPGTHYHL